MKVKYIQVYTKVHVTISHVILRIEQMARFLDSLKIGSFTDEQLMNLKKSSIDEFGVKHRLNINLRHLESRKIKARDIFRSILATII